MVKSVSFLSLVFARCDGKEDKKFGDADWHSPDSVSLEIWTRSSVWCSKKFGKLRCSYCTFNASTALSSAGKDCLRPTLSQVKASPRLLVAHRGSGSTPAKRAWQEASIRKSPNRSFNKTFHNPNPPADTALPSCAQVSRPSTNSPNPPSLWLLTNRHHGAEQALVRPPTPPQGLPMPFPVSLTPFRSAGSRTRRRPCTSATSTSAPRRP